MNPQKPARTANSRLRPVVPGVIATMFAVSLLSSLSYQYGHADAPIAERAADVRPVAVGEPAPRFMVRTVSGDNFDFDPRNLERPTILISFRGGWCPYCNMHLSELRDVIPAISKMDVDVLFLSGDRPSQLYDSLKGETQDDIAGLGYRILSDGNANAAVALGIAFRASPATIQRRLDKGQDVEGSSMVTSGVLPVPAVFAIGKDGIVTYSHVVPDYKVRLPAGDLLAVAEALVGESG